MRPLEFRSRAEDEILDAYRWYQQSRYGLGKAFADAVESAIARIVRIPFVHPCVDEETRRAPVHDFPYAIYYEVLLTHIDVVSITHTRRNPRRWQRRRRSVNTSR
jgi:plasmid stabilization system protein ParE